MYPAIGVGATLLALAGLVYWLTKRSRFQHHERQLSKAKQTFHLRREWLEAKFLTLASQSGKPRGLEWKDCEFQDDVTLARDRKTGQLSAFVGVTISFRAIEGGGMEHVEAVGNLRAGTAVFSLDAEGNWFTEGRAIFNLNPHHAIAHFHNEVELVSDA